MKNGVEELLIDFSTPGPSRQDGGEISMSGAENVADPFSPMSRRTPGKTNAEGGSTEALEEVERKRQQEKKAILERRAARRKSLANRRVSFAPEATLHTWSVMELVEDSTTSSASNSTRRQSSMTVAQSPVKSLRTPERIPSTPTAQTEDIVVKESPAHQRDLHQRKRRRRSSGLAEPMLDASQDEVFSSSPSGDVTTNSSPLRVEEGIESSDESDTDGDTAMSIDDGTAHTINSQDSPSSTRSSLEERLQQAAALAGTRGIEYDENGDDMTMELATGTVTHAFQPWARNHVDQDENSAIYDQENVDPFLASHSAPATQQTEEAEIEAENLEQTEDMSMDITKAVGGIVSGRSPGKKTRKSPVSRRQSSIRGRRSSGDESAYEETMDFTVMQGGILPAEDEQVTEHTSARAANEDMSMEFTNVIGGVLGDFPRRESVVSEQTDENEAMDMTAAVGGILAPIEEQTEPQTDAEDGQTMAMEMTSAVGGILGGNKRSARQASVGDSTATGIDSASPRTQPAERTTPKSTTKSDQHLSSVASETGSPSLALKPRFSGRSQRNSPKLSTTPQTAPPHGTPVKSASSIRHSTPSKQITPLPARAGTSNKTPLSANITHRSASPKKLFKAEIKARNSPASAKREANLKAHALFSRDAETGQQTPSVILRATRPQSARTRSSGIGIDKNGIGSPKVSELLDRRASIGDAAPQFKLGSIEPGRLRFEEPQQLEREVEAERAEEHRRESGRFIMEQEADGPVGENNTVQLKDMIEAMSPKKTKISKLKGRKSLAVGAAKGLLGKRPAELDMDDEDEADSTPKRLRIASRDGSPVKKVHLPNPPSKDETTGRLSTKLQKSLQELAGTDNKTPTVEPTSRTRNNTAVSPSTAGRYKDVNTSNDGRPESFEDKLDNVVGAIDISTAKIRDGSDRDEDEKVTLQQFLNMTNIHFIELSTTKRRHTMAQSLPLGEAQEGVDDSTEANFVAAATTLPLLELYQHATRELKTYISTGRKIIRSIEAETLTEQPPLFREYVDARADVKLVMDNQFRNGKANARLQSKEGWYQWRAQLVEGLKTGLQGINQGMNHDLELLHRQQQTLDSVVPPLLREQSELQHQQTSLEQSLEELDSVDQAALKSFRQRLQSADDYYLQRSAILETLQQQIQANQEALSAAAELKAEMKDQIAEADRVREEHKGWPAADVQGLKSKVEALEKQTGWRLITAEEEVDEPNEFGPALTMTYKNELRLFFYPRAFECKSKNASRRRSGRKSASTSGPTAPLSLTFASTNQDEFEGPAPEQPTEKRFFLQMIRSQLHAFTMMPKGSVTSKTLLTTVSQGWDLACKVSKEVRLLNLASITNVSILGDEKLGVKVMLVTPNQGRIDVEFAVTLTIINDGEIIASTNVTANAIYGSAAEALSGTKSRKVQNALGKEVESRTLGEGAMVSAIHGLEEWLRAQDNSRQETKEVEEAVTAPPLPSVVDTSVPPAAPTTRTKATPSAPKRSPLAPKRTNATQKKALPVPKQRFEKLNPPTLLSSQQQQPTSVDKENFHPSLSVSGKLSIKEQEDGTVAENDWDDAKPAIPPEMQEAMMHTPIKRVGALRRSPI